MKRDARLQSLFYISFRVPSKGALPPDLKPSSYYIYHQVYNLQQILRSADKLHLFALYRSEIQQRLFHYKALLVLFIAETECVYCEVRNESLTLTLLTWRIW
jgi:hypothetical protein